ncbi:MAG: hypothetical protein HUU08_01045 [Candidatus Brocadia sp.]|nr:hypothetical protein [Candidatus Brocadia sp.]
MGVARRTNSITIEFGCQFLAESTDNSLEAILKAFCKLLPEILRDFIQKVLVEFGESAMVQSREPFSSDECGNAKVPRPTINEEPEILTLNDFFKGGVKFVTIATVRDNSYNTKKFQIQIT